MFDMGKLVRGQSRRFILLTGLLLSLSSPSSYAMKDGPEGPWDGFPRTQPTPRYESDPSSDPNHTFGVTKAFSPYKDPDIAPARDLPNPLDDSDFDSYNLIVVISKADDPFWGPEQTLRVYQRGSGLIYYWLVSTGMQGHETASGYFSPKEFSSRHWSSEYDAPMMWSVFFHGGMALHSSLDRGSIGDMGKAAESHGCVHEEDYRAEEMFHLIGHSGFGPVNQINERTGKKTGSVINAYKALIIIGPTTRWDSNNRQPIPATAPLEASTQATSDDNSPLSSDDTRNGTVSKSAPSNGSDTPLTAPENTLYYNDTQH